jgi:hypothetical protein
MRSPVPTILLAAQSMGASFTLPAGQGSRVTALRSFSIALRWTGAPVGNFQMQASHDGTNWFDRGGPVSGGAAAGDILFEEDEAFFNWVRIDWDRTSGTGVADATLVGVEK